MTIRALAKRFLVNLPGLKRLCLFLTCDTPRIFMYHRFYVGEGVGIDEAILNGS